MTKFSRGFFWFGLLYAALAYSFLGGLFLVNPAIIESYAVTLNAPHAYSAIRAGFGAQFLGLAFIAWWGIFFKAQRWSALAIVTVLTGIIVICRLVGLTVDGMTPINLTELRDEGISFVVFLLAVWCGRISTVNDNVA